MTEIGQTSALLKKNLSLLESLDKGLWKRVKDNETPCEYRVYSSITGSTTLRARETHLHSSYAPEEEGIQWVEYHLKRWDGLSTPLVFGMGLGYHIEELAKKIERNFVVVEPDLNVFRIALEHIDLSGLISKAGFIVAPDDNELNMLCKDNYHLMLHTPTVGLHPALYQKIEKKIKLRERYRILVAGPIYGGSLPVAGYCASALKELDYETELIDLSLFNGAFQGLKDFTSKEDNQNKLKGLFTVLMSELIMARVVEFKPDLVFALAQTPLTEDVLKRLRGYKIPTAFWFVEDFRTMRYWKEIAPLYDYFFTIQDGEFFKHLKGLGVMNCHYLPMAAAPSIHKSLHLSGEEAEEYRSELSFVGAGYYNRRNFFLNLIDCNLKIWGNEWDGALPLYGFIQKNGERISTEEIVRIFNASKININLHSSKQHAGVNPYGDFVNPRTFEIAACGAFQLVDFRSDLPRFFEIGKEVICFRDEKDIRDKIEYYLQNEKERKAIADEGRRRVLREHTYTKRMEEMMGFLIDKGFEGSALLPGRYMVKDLVKEACEDTELARYLSRFMDRRYASLNDIIHEIGSGKGNLSQEEKIFIAMNEFAHRKG